MQSDGTRFTIGESFFDPSGLMGDIGDVRMERSAGADRFTYETNGTGPHEWDYKYVDGVLNPKPAEFAGVMYLDPPNNFGQQSGVNLGGTRHVFSWEARSEESTVNVEFIIGGVVWMWSNGCVFR